MPMGSPWGCLALLLTCIAWLLLRRSSWWAARSECGMCRTSITQPSTADSTMPAALDTCVASSHQAKLQKPVRRKEHAAASQTLMTPMMADSCSRYQLQEPLDTDCTAAARLQHYASSSGLAHCTGTEQAEGVTSLMCDSMAYVSNPSHNTDLMACQHPHTSDQVPVQDCTATLRPLRCPSSSSSSCATKPITPLAAGIVASTSAAALSPPASPASVLRIPPLEHGPVDLTSPPLSPLCMQRAVPSSPAHQGNLYLPPHSPIRSPVLHPTVTFNSSTGVATAHDNPLCMSSITPPQSPFRNTRIISTVVTRGNTTGTWFRNSTDVSHITPAAAPQQRNDGRTSHVLTPPWGAPRARRGSILDACALLSDKCDRNDSATSLWHSMPSLNQFAQSVQPAANAAEAEATRVAANPANANAPTPTPSTGPSDAALPPSPLTSQLATALPKLSEATAGHCGDTLAQQAAQQQEPAAVSSDMQQSQATAASYLDAIPQVQRAQTAAAAAATAAAGPFGRQLSSSSMQGAEHSMQYLTTLHEWEGAVVSGGSPAHASVEPSFSNQPGAQQRSMRARTSDRDAFLLGDADCDCDLQPTWPCMLTLADGLSKDDTPEL